MALQDKLPKRLPIFRVSARETDVQSLYEVGSAMFDVKEFLVRERGSRLILHADSKIVEINRLSGGIWAADKSQLWNPEIKPDLPGNSEAHEFAESFLRKHKLLPTFKSSQPFIIDFTSFGRTLVAISKKNERPQPFQLDTQVNYFIP